CIPLYIYNLDIYNPPLHDALPIWRPPTGMAQEARSRLTAPAPASREITEVMVTPPFFMVVCCSRSSVGQGSLLEQASDGAPGRPDRKSTRLNSSHVKISYAVFCLK